jgi:hypothetical protein
MPLDALHGRVDVDHHAAPGPLLAAMLSRPAELADRQHRNTTTITFQLYSPTQVFVFFGRQTPFHFVVLYANAMVMQLQRIAAAVAQIQPIQGFVRGTTPA